MSKRIAWLLFAVLLATALASLGRWQLGRATEKQAMLDAVESALADSRTRPLAPSHLRAANGYDRVATIGQFRSAPALLLDNQRRGQQVGIRVFGVFQPRDTGALLVDLGWLPLPGDRRLPAIELPPGTLSISGLLAPPPSAGLALGPDHVVSDARRWLLGRVETDSLSRALGTPLARRTLRLDPALPIGYTRDLDVLPNTLSPERHRGYALQWFGLSAAVIVAFLFLGFGRHRK